MLAGWSSTQQLAAPGSPGCEESCLLSNETKVGAAGSGLGPQHGPGLGSHVEPCGTPAPAHRPTAWGHGGRRAGGRL